MICSLLLTVLLMPATAPAAEVSGLYEAEVQVYSQKRSERATAMASALAEVLTKVSGRRNAALIEGVAKATRRPARFLQQYRYRELTEAERTALLPEGEEAAPAGEPQMLRFRFDKTSVDKVLLDNGLPVWGATRPATLVWLAVQDDERRYLVGADAAEPVRALLSQEAQRRGLALLLPLLDLQDQMALRFADVWGGFREPVLRASTRYRTEAVLVGRLYRTPSGEWQGQWMLMQDEQAQTWAGAGALPAEVIDEGVAGAVDVLAARYAPVAGQQKAGLLPVTVTEVRNLGDYARVSRYLQSLQQVSRVHISRVEADRISFELDIKGGPESVKQTIALGNMLVPDRQAAIEASGTVMPWAQTPVQVYQLQP
jgi:hypothetical protein